ncbi:MAG: restriction endonuclease subunit S [Desulfovibrio sp.]|uniref:restriction endonuclease subunit S n=1 Tax=Desulfovibrio sp. TaxID=885 RepID=UPI00135D9793|nr:restriction endonuclease subunit S [Desulfovibrio sp.]MTJ92896.1 restriction endonuclease subunit S [Desulfovibrio sp.]
MRERNWQTVRLGDVADVQSGGTPQVTESQYWGGDIPWYSSGELNTTFTNESNKYITKSGLENSNAKLFPKGSLLIGMYDTAALKMSILDRDAAFNQAICGIKPSKHIDLLFVLQAITLNRDYILCQRRGVRQKNLNLTKIKDIQVPLPPLPEQQRIVAILDEAFEGIAKAKANAEQNLKNAREVFESHLQAVFSQRGEGWIGKTLRQIAVDFGRGKSKHRPRNDPRLYGGPYPFIQTGDVRNSEHMITEFTQTYSEVGLSQSKLWPKGTLCITIAANIAETGILNFDACFPDSVIGIIVDENQSNNVFLEYLLQATKTVLKAKGKGSAQDNINLGTFENEIFFFPKLAAQNIIARQLDELSAETQRLESIYQRKIAALDELKKSLLHKAFSGEL